MTPVSKRIRAYRRGVIAEYLAAVFLTFKGYRVLERRYRCRAGEIDLIVRRGKTIVFVEVKSRDSLENALEAVTHAGRERITRAALCYMSGVPEQEKFTQRFDVIAFSSPFFVRHVRNAWFAGF